ncbi:aspartyl/glutamyl-tRNA(Asn/Gln) amidotransferasesubunit C, partial [Striga asiatica]
YCTPSPVTGSSFIPIENNNNSGKVSYQWRSVLHTSQSLPLSNITNVFETAPVFTPLNSTSKSIASELEKITITQTPYTNISSDLMDHTSDGQLLLTELKRKRGRPKKVLGSTSTQTEYWDMGDASIECAYCEAMFWYAERKSSERTSAVTKYGGCCVN